MNKKYPFKTLTNKAETNDAIVDVLWMLKTGTEWSWGFDILVVDDDTIIERYTNKKYTIYLHYSRSKKIYKWGEYKHIKIKGDNTWYIFKACVYEKKGKVL